MRPLIGITSYAEEIRWGVWTEEAALIPLSYVRAVERAGGPAARRAAERGRSGGDARACWMD